MDRSHENKDRRADMAFQKLPMWKDENPEVYRKQQTSRQITRLKRERIHAEVNGFVDRVQEIDSEIAILQSKK